jgi:hypothetical protein
MWVGLVLSLPALLVCAATLVFAPCYFVYMLLQGNGIAMVTVALVADGTFMYYCGKAQGK